MEYRCYHPHPKFAGQKCNKFVAEGTFTGDITVPCSRCGKGVVCSAPALAWTEAANTVTIVDKDGVTV